MGTKVRFIELGKGDFQVAVPVASWQELVEVKKGVIDHLTILGDEIETTELIEIEGTYWFIIGVKRRPGLFKAIEISVVAVLRKLRKRKALEKLTTKVYHPAMKTLLIPTPSRKVGLELRKALIEYIEDQLKGRVIVGEVNYQGRLEVTCSIDQMPRIIRPLRSYLGGKKTLLRVGALK